MKEGKEGPPILHLLRDVASTIDVFREEKEEQDDEDEDGVCTRPSLSLSPLSSFDDGC